MRVGFVGLLPELMDVWSAKFVMLNLEQAEFANEAFYLAFEAKDYEAMCHLWSQTHEVVCLHPGWPILVGRQQVLDSWRNILGNPQQVQVSFYGARCLSLGSGSAAVVCYEQAGESVMVATNVFSEVEGRLRLVSHQAGYCANPPSISQV